MLRSKVIVSLCYLVILIMTAIVYYENGFAAAGAY